MNSLYAFFVQSYDRYAAKPALNCRGHYYTYKQTMQKVASIKAALKKPDHLIGVLTGDDMPTIASILAILGVGSAYVPINRHNPAERNRIIAADAGLKLVLASEITPELKILEADGVKILLVNELTDAPIDTTLPETAPDSLAYLLYTSGSTGKPKGVPVYHRNLSAFMEIMTDGFQYDFKPTDRFLQMFELTFDLSVFSLFAPFAVGACCYVVPSDGVQFLKISEMLEDCDITVALLAPSVLAYLQKYFDEIELPALKYSLFCGEALPARLVEGWRNCTPNAIIENVYGPTEATIFCLRYLWEGEASAEESVNGVTPIGLPLATMACCVVNDEGKPLPFGEQGELCLIGYQVTDRYWNEPEKSAAAFIQIPVTANITSGESLDLNAMAVNGQLAAYRTGDLCYLNANGQYIYCGRLDAQVKIDGYRVELGEIEHHARQFVGHSRLACVAAPNEHGQTQLRLFVAEAGYDSAELKAYLQSQLPVYMQPAAIVVLDELPLNANGKVDRKALAGLVV